MDPNRTYLDMFDAMREGDHEPARSLALAPVSVHASSESSKTVTLLGSYPSQSLKTLGLTRINML
jgi:hypothetical protein